MAEWYHQKRYKSYTFLKFTEFCPVRREGAAVSGVKLISAAACGVIT
jgi:hypothetical protein